MHGMIIDHRTGDLLIEGGSVTLGSTDAQIAESVLVSQRGEWKEFPLLGGEVRSMLGGEKDPMWRVRVKKMLRRCGLEVQHITLTPEGVITLN